MTDRPRITIDLTNPTLQAETVTLQQSCREVEAAFNTLLIAAASLKATLEMMDYKGNA